MADEAMIMKTLDEAIADYKESARRKETGEAQSKQEQARKAKELESNASRFFRYEYQSTMGIDLSPLTFIAKKVAPYIYTIRIPLPANKHWKYIIEWEGRVCYQKQDGGSSAFSLRMPTGVPWKVIDRLGKYEFFDTLAGALVAAEYGSHDKQPQDC